MMKNWFVYILQCNDGTLYIGCTDNLDKRVLTHNNGKGAKYTRGRLPVSLVYKEKQETHSLALKREIELKTFSRKDKEKLIHGVI